MVQDLRDILLLTNIYTSADKHSMVKQSVFILDTYTAFCPAKPKGSNCLQLLPFGLAEQSPLGEAES